MMTQDGLAIIAGMQRMTKQLGRLASRQPSRVTEKRRGAVAAPGCPGGDTQGGAWHDSL
jgi:hypothetical protein